MFANCRQSSYQTKKHALISCFASNSYVSNTELLKHKQFTITCSSVLLEIFKVLYNFDDFLIMIEKSDL